jgi:protein gp37
MGKNTAIEWATHTFNPWWGCAKVSPACDNCYAQAFAHRMRPGTDYWQPAGERRTFGPGHWQEPLRWHRETIAKGLPTPRVFCASMADVFDKDAPRDARTQLWNVIRATPAMRWLLLTKRIGNARAMLPPFWCELNTAALGITVVTPWELERDFPKLARLPAPMRFLSIEPMLEPIDLAPYLHPVGDASPIDWVIVGGESGARARPLAARWVRSIRDQCKAAGVAFFFKQWGEWAPPEQYAAPAMLSVISSLTGTDGFEHSPKSASHRYVDGEYILRAGKKNTGRMLDGATHSELPTFRAVA